ncbi:HAD family hydrolase [Mesorhizobium sp. 10J20-29]
MAFVGIDADDTLWHNEHLFRLTQRRFVELLAEFADSDVLERRLSEIERANISVYGYGAKGFTLSLIETALDISHSQVSTDVVRELLEAGRELLLQPVEPLPGVLEALRILSAGNILVLITKGDLIHQEAKLAGSGLGQFFSGVEIVSEKSPDTYRQIFRRYGARPEYSVMAGNSIRSDILPALAAGSFAALVPYPLVWNHETADAPLRHPRFKELGALGELPCWMEVIGLWPGM